MKENALRRVIDQMVEESIRRILPTVMNEVLLRTIAQSGVVAEARPQRPTRQPVREQRRPTKVPPRRRPDLSELLDPTAGADFYQDPRPTRVVREEARQEYYDEPEPEEDEVPMGSPVAQRIASLPPALQQMAEGMTLDDDDGEMWGEDEHDSVPGLNESAGSGVVTDPTPIRDVNRAAKAVGIDFSRMRGVIAQTSPPKRVDREDLQARAQFEQLRLKRERERLNGGKPVE